MEITIMEDHRRFLPILKAAGILVEKKSSDNWTPVSNEVTAATTVFERGIEAIEDDVNICDGECPGNIFEEDMAGAVCKLEIRDDERIKTQLNRLIGIYAAYPRWQLEATIFVYGLSFYYLALRGVVDEMPYCPSDDDELLTAEEVAHLTRRSLASVVKLQERSLRRHLVTVPKKPTREQP